MIKEVLLWMLGIAVIILVLLVALFFVRLGSDRYLDDVSPGIPCDAKLLEKIDILFVVPKFENRSIADNKEWCAEIIALNRSLAMHGVYHTYEEFNQDRNAGYIQDGAEAFKGCFGVYPERFKAPQLVISRNNAKMIEEDYELDGKIKQIFHKTYHCNDGGKYPNWVQNLI